MPKEAIPEEIHRFILTSIPSVPFLEAVLAHRRSGAAPMEAHELSRRLYLSESASLPLQEALHEAGILAPIAGGAGYYFSPATPELAGMLDRVAHLYAKDLIGVTNIIHSKTSRKALQFADAFKWRKDS